jgi:hypothetical protein
MLRRPKHSKNEVVAPKEEEEYCNMYYLSRPIFYTNITKIPVNVNRVQKHGSYFSPFIYNSGFANM